MTAHVHIYRLDGEAADALPEAFFACLPNEERRRATLPRQARDRRNRLLAYASLFHLLHWHSGVAAAQIRLARDGLGKPRPVLPDGAPPLQANLSHSADCVLIAIAPCPIGVDVEAIRPLDIAAINRSLFPHDGPGANDPDTFYAAWTAREAVLKALGAGLSADPGAIVPRPRSPHFQSLAGYPPDMPLATARVANLAMPPGYAGAVAALHADPRYDLQHLDSGSLRHLAKC